MSPATRHPAAARRGEVWTRYWQALPADAASGSFAGGYEGQSIGLWWAGHMRTSASMQWLDLATGNGALPRLWAASPAHAGHMTAVDLAQLHLPWLQGLPGPLRGRIDCLSGVDMEALPFADAVFDRVISQFGVEYADLARVVDEAIRVLVPGGRLMWVLHDAAGRPARLARVEIEHIDWLLSPTGLYHTTTTMVGPMSRLADPRAAETLATDAQALSARQGHDAALGRLQAQAAVSACPDVLFEAQDAAVQVLTAAMRQGPQAASSLAERWRLHLEDSRFRLAELVGHALDEARLRWLVAELGARGCSVTTGTIEDRGYRMAHGLTAERQH